MSSSFPGPFLSYRIISQHRSSQSETQTSSHLHGKILILEITKEGKSARWERDREREGRRRSFRSTTGRDDDGDGQMARKNNKTEKERAKNREAAAERHSRGKGERAETKGRAIRKIVIENNSQFWSFHLFSY